MAQARGFHPFHETVPCPFKTGVSIGVARIPGADKFAIPDLTPLDTASENRCESGILHPYAFGTEIHSIGKKNASRFQLRLNFPSLFQREVFDSAILNRLETHGITVVGKREINPQRLFQTDTVSLHGFDPGNKPRNVPQVQVLAVKRFQRGVAGAVR